MISLINEPPKFMYINNTYPNIKKVTDYLKDMSKYLCKRKETLTTDYVNVLKDYILENINNLKNKSSYSCIYAY